MRPTSGETVYQLEEGDFAWSVDQACGSALLQSGLPQANDEKKRCIALGFS